MYSKVQEFHEKLGFHVNQPLLKAKSPAVAETARFLLVRSHELETEGLDSVEKLRAHLMMEELAEVLRALEDGDELALLDGLADLLYVVYGTAVSYNLPLDEAFEEVHRSNMTKRPNGPRCRDKGPDYEPPNLKDLLEKRDA